MQICLNIGLFVWQDAMGFGDEPRINNIDQFVLGNHQRCYLQGLQLFFSFWVGIAMSEFNKPSEPKTQQQFYDELRNKVIEEVAREIEVMFRTPFGKDTIDSFAVYVRRMKK